MRTARDTWAAFTEVTETFVNLSDMPETISDENFRTLQRFVILLYDRVDKARKLQFAKGGQLDCISTTDAALSEHIKWLHTK